MSSSQNGLRPLDGSDVIMPKSIKIISYHKKTSGTDADQGKSRSTNNRVGSVVGGARRQSDQQLNLDLPGVETHVPLPITHSEDYYQYLRHTDHHIGHSQSKKAHVASTRQRLDSR